MSDEQVAMNPDYVHQLKWYYWPRLPLLPDWKFRPANKHNEWAFWFHWLIFRFWTTGSPELGIWITIDDQELKIVARIPYVIAGFYIPLFPYKWHQKLWRYPRPDWVKE